MLFSGVVLAAGRSTRMGRDKALLLYRGVPLWEHQWQTLATAGIGPRVLSVRADQRWVPAGWPVVHDASPDAGPLAGIVAAFGAFEASATHLAVLAIDLPRLPATWFVELSRHCRPGVGAVGRNGGYYEPLAAIYPIHLRESAALALVNGEQALQPLVRRAVSAGALEEVSIDGARTGWFENWNDPASMTADPTAGVQAP